MCSENNVLKNEQMTLQEVHMYTFRMNSVSARLTYDSQKR